MNTTLLGSTLVTSGFFSKLKNDQRRFGRLSAFLFCLLADLTVCHHFTDSNNQIVLFHCDHFIVHTKTSSRGRHRSYHANCDESQYNNREEVHHEVQASWDQLFITDGVENLTAHCGIDPRFSFSRRVTLGRRLRWSSTQLPTHLSMRARTAGSFAPDSNRSLALSLQCIVHRVRRSWKPNSGC